MTGAAAGPGLLFAIPNDGPHPHPKLIRVQVTFLDVIPIGVLDVPGAGTLPMGPPTVITPLPDHWTHAYWDLTLPFCPPFEFIGLGAPPGAHCFIDQVVIDTYCIPTPGGVVLAGFGVLVAVRRRR